MNFNPFENKILYAVRMKSSNTYLQYIHRGNEGLGYVTHSLSQAKRAYTSWSKSPKILKDDLEIVEFKVDTLKDVKVINYGK